MALSEQFNAEVKKLDLGPDSILIIKSDDIDTDTIRTIRKELGYAKVFGIGRRDDVYVLNVKPTDTVVIRSDAVDAEVIQLVKEKLGVAVVLGIGTDDNIEVKNCPCCGYPNCRDAQTPVGYTYPVSTSIPDSE